MDTCIYERLRLNLRLRLYCLRRLLGRPRRTGKLRRKPLEPLAARVLDERGLVVDAEAVVGLRPRLLRLARDALWRLWGEGGQGADGDVGGLEERGDVGFELVSAESR